MGKRGRPVIENREEVRKRATITVLPEIQDMAKELGEGNISRGIERAIRELYGKHQTLR